MRFLAGTLRLEIAPNRHLSGRFGVTLFEKIFSMARYRKSSRHITARLSLPDPMDGYWLGSPQDLFIENRETKVCGWNVFARSDVEVTARLYVVPLLEVKEQLEAGRLGFGPVRGEWSATLT